MARNSRNRAKLGSRANRDLRLTGRETNQMGRDPYREYRETGYAGGAESYDRDNYQGATFERDYGRGRGDIGHDRPHQGAADPLMYGYGWPGYGWLGAGMGDPGDHAVHRGYGSPGRRGGGYRQPFEKRDDDEIRDDIYDELDDDPSIPDNAEVKVDVKDGVVILTGTVRNRWTKDAVGRCAWETPGVHDVNNDVAITSRRREFATGQQNVSGRERRAA